MLRLKDVISKRERLLIITENFTHGGLETQIRGQIQNLARFGWDVYLACGDNFLNTHLPKEVKNVYYGLNFSPLATVNDLKKTTSEIIGIIEKKKITHIHAHPFTSILPSILAGIQSNTPVITTIHGPASLSTGYGENFDRLNISALLLSSKVISVSKEVSDILLQSGIKSEVLPNAVGFKDSGHRFKLKSLHQTRWIIAARLDIDKTVGLKMFISTAIRAGVKEIAVAGDGSEYTNLKQWCERRFQNQVKLIGYIENLQEILPQYDACAGMGRVVLESASQGIPTCLVGYDGVKSIIRSADELDKFSDRNLSGRSASNIVSKTFIKQYNELDDYTLGNLSRHIHDQFDEKKIWKRYNQMIRGIKYDKQYSYSVKWENIIGGDVWINSKKLLHTITLLDEVWNGTK